MTTDKLTDACNLLIDWLLEQPPNQERSRLLDALNAVRSKVEISTETT